MKKRITAILGAIFAVLAGFCFFPSVKSASAADTISTSYNYTTTIERAPLSAPDNTNTWFTTIDYYFNFDFTVYFNRNTLPDDNSFYFESIDIYPTFRRNSRQQNTPNDYDRELTEYAKFNFTNFQYSDSTINYWNMNRSFNTLDIFQRVGTSGGGKIVSPYSPPTYTSKNLGYFLGFKSNLNGIRFNQTPTIFKYEKSYVYVDSNSIGGGVEGEEPWITYYPYSGSYPGAAAVYKFFFRTGSIIEGAGTIEEPYISFLIFDGLGKTDLKTTYYFPNTEDFADEQYDIGYAAGYGNGRAVATQEKDEEYGNVIQALKDEFQDTLTREKEDSEYIGYTRGVSEGLKNSTPVQFLGTIFDTFHSIFDIKILGVVSVGTLIFIPVFLSLIFLILRIVRGN